MVYVDIGAMFVTTFMGAFLAFGLENRRERHRMTEWVRRHMGHLRDLMAGESDTVARVDAFMASQIAACDAWLAAPDADAVSEEQWELLETVVNAQAPDFGAVLRSEAITAVPADLALAMVQTEYAGVGLEHVSRSARDARDVLMPLWFDRVAPLSEPDRRRVQRFRGTLVELAEAVHHVRQPLHELMDAIGKWLD